MAYWHSLSVPRAHIAARVQRQHRIQHARERHRVLSAIAVTSGGFERNDSINNVGSHARVNFGGANQPKGLGGKEPNMLIIGCDYHPGFQQIACVDLETGELSVNPKQFRSSPAQGVGRHL